MVRCDFSALLYWNCLARKRTACYERVKHGQHICTSSSYGGDTSEEVGSICGIVEIECGAMNERKDDFKDAPCLFILRRIKQRKHDRLTTQNMQVPGRGMYHLL